MNQRQTLRLLISSAVVSTAIVVVSLSASAQTATTTTTTTTTSTTAVKKPTTATAQMIQEACQRQKARTAKLLQSGVPEQFGSEEPFTFDLKAPPC